MRWAAVRISAISSLCVSVAGGMLSSTLVGSVCTLCCAVDQLSVLLVLTISVREKKKENVIIDQQNVQKKRDSDYYCVKIKPWHYVGHFHFAHVMASWTQSIYFSKLITPIVPVHNQILISWTCRCIAPPRPRSRYGSSHSCMDTVHTSHISKLFSSYH